MVDCGVVLCHVVAFIVWSRNPIVAKLKLLDPIAQPVESHVHGFRAARGDGVVDHTKCRRVVGLYVCWGLGVAHLGESMTGWDCFAEINVEGAELGLGGGGHDGFDDLCGGEDGAVVGWVGRIIGHEKCLLARLRAFDSERYNAPECTTRTISLAW